MFFVAFHMRQRKIVEQSDTQDSLKVPSLQVQLGSQSVNDKLKQERALRGITAELNVDILEHEITLDAC